jgi:Flp pilus assembly protein TadG
MFWSRPTRERCRQSGKSLIETALSMVIIIVVIFWIFELSWLLYTHSVLADAANEGVRYAIVHSGGDASGTEAVVLKFARTSLHDVSAMTTTVEFPEGDALPPHRVRVTVRYPYIAFLPKLIGSPTMSAYAEGAMVMN